MLPILLVFLHTTNDMFGSFLTPLLPRLQAAFGVDYARVSMLVAIYSMSSSLFQPVAGLIADRYDKRWLAALGPLLVAIGVGLVGWYPNIYLFAFVLAFAGLGSALFHSSAAALVGQYAPENKKGFWISIFGSGGHLGMSLAPAVSIGIAKNYGLPNITWLVPFALIPAVLFLKFAPVVKVPGKRSGFKDLLRVFRGEVAKLWALATLRILAFSSLTTTIPYWFGQLGISDERMALALTVSSISGIVGTLVGGMLSDRLGRKIILTSSLGLAIPLYILLVTVSPHSWIYIPLLSIAAIVSTASIPVTVVMAQNYEPSQIATVSGLMMGFTWGFAGLLYGGVGPLVEIYGVLNILRLIGLLLIPALIIALSLKQEIQTE